MLKAKVSVFVNLYLKNSQLRDEADSLSAGLGAVEETAAQLSGRIRRLRDALEAFGGGAG